MGAQGSFTDAFTLRGKREAVWKVYSLRINVPCCPDYQVALAHPQPSYKTPIHVSPGLSPQQLGVGGSAILKLQVRHIPETAKLELCSNLSCFLQ